jgi:hypothetical protein
MASFLVAYAIWLTGTASHPACDPDSLLQAHAVWHVLSAVATLAFFGFLRTARPGPYQPGVSPTESSAGSAASGSSPS